MSSSHSSSSGSESEHEEAAEPLENEVGFMGTRESMSVDLPGEMEETNVHHDDSHSEGDGPGEYSGHEEEHYEEEGGQGGEPLPGESTLSHHMSGEEDVHMSSTSSDESEHGHGHGHGHEHGHDISAKSGEEMYRQISFMIETCPKEYIENPDSFALKVSEAVNNGFFEKGMKQPKIKTKKDQPAGLTPDRKSAQHHITGLWITHFKNEMPISLAVRPSGVDIPTLHHVSDTGVEGAFIIPPISEMGPIPTTSKTSKMIPLMDERRIKKAKSNLKKVFDGYTAENIGHGIHDTEKYSRLPYNHAIITLANMMREKQGKGPIPKELDMENLVAIPKGDCKRLMTYFKDKVDQRKVNNLYNLSFQIQRAFDIKSTTTATSSETLDPGHSAPKRRTPRSRTTNSLVGTKTSTHHTGAGGGGEHITAKKNAVNCCRDKELFSQIESESGRMIEASEMKKLYMTVYVRYQPVV